MSAEPRAGQLLDHYRLLEELGKGGMGVVWLAQDTRLGRNVALKLLPPEAARDAVRRQRFEQEARAAAALSHPGIATVYELAEAEGHTFIALEYVPGTTLRQWVVPGGIPRAELLDMAGEISAAIAAAHTAGVVHRDLKPENVMRTPAGGCKVLDFGLARLSAPATSDAAAETRSVLTGSGVVLGTAGYMAPEQLEGKEVDFRCDLFSFGTLLYELATGVHPFESGSSASTITAIMSAEPRPLTQRNPRQPPELERIVRKCLRKRREERYQSTNDLAVDLANLKRDSDERPIGVAIAVPTTDDDSLVRRMFSFFATSPRRWWEIRQLIFIFLYSPLCTFLIFWAGEKFLRLPSSESARSAAHGFEKTVFVGMSILLVAASLARAYLLRLAIIWPADRLGAEVKRLQPVLRGIYFLVGGLAAISAWSIGHKVGPEEFEGGLALGAFVGLAMVNLVLAPLESAAERSAFPAAYAESDKDRARRSLLLRTAAVHLPYLLVLFAPLTTGKLALDEVMAGINFHPGASQLVVFAYSLVMTIGGSALIINGFQIVMEGNAGLHVFRRWFGAYLGVAVAATGAWIWMALDGNIPAVVALAVSVILLVLPFAQLRMARQALAESGEMDAEKAKPKMDRRFTAIALCQLLMLGIYVDFLWAAAMARDSHPVAAFLRAVDAGRMIVVLLSLGALPVLAGILVSSASFAVRSLKGEKQALRIFLRLFPVFWLLDEAWVVPLFWLASQVSDLRSDLIFWLILVLGLPLAAVPFYQRRLARSILKESDVPKQG